jgi:transposase
MIKCKLSFKKLIRDYVLRKSLYTPNVNSKYTIDQIIDVIEYVLITGSSWRSLDLPIFKTANIKWQSIYYHFIKFSKANVFKNVYLELLNRYFKTNKAGKLKYLSIDSSFILNAYASNVGYNGFYKKKKLSKLSLIVDSNGIPISILLAKGNKADPSLFQLNIDKLLISIDYNNDNNKHKRYFLADAAYDSRRINDDIKQLNITPIIWRSRRAKNLQKFNKKETAIYKNRIIVENCFSWIFKCRRVNRRYDKNINTYMSFIFASLCRLLMGRI